MPAVIVAGDAAPAERAALLRDDFASFAAWCFRELNPRSRFVNELACRADLGDPRNGPPELAPGESWGSAVRGRRRCARAGSAGRSSACRRAIRSRTWPRSPVRSGLSGMTRACRSSASPPGSQATVHRDRSPGARTSAAGQFLFAPLVFFQNDPGLLEQHAFDRAG
jgi:hypothetical protein